MRTELATSRIEATPGEPATVDIEVTNTTDVIDGVTAVVEGLDPAWVELVVPVVRLFPESAGALSLRITVPRDCPAGEYLVVVRVLSTVDSGRFSTHDFWLTVLPVKAAALALRPSLVTGGGSTVIDAVITNQGNVAADFDVAARDESRVLDCSTASGTIEVAAGEVASVAVRARGPRPWFGQAASRSIVVTATADELELEALATFNQKPRIPRGALTIAMLAAIVALWATIFILVVGLLGDDTKPTKAVATSFNGGGTENVSLSAVAGALAGSVRAETSGDGLARVTVEAYRAKPDGTLELTASAATDDEGAYALAGLLPGTYKLRFTGDGYDERWFPAAPDQGAAEALALEPAGDVGGLDMALAGGSGALRGTMVAGDGSTPRPITVTVRRQPEGATPTPGGVGGAPEPAPIVVETTGDIAIDGLATPGDYVVRVESEGFEPQEFTETLAGGETKVLNSVRLGAAAGALGGTVTDGDGGPLGNVKVTVTSGEFKKEVTTPTAGNVGTFVVDGLETPKTYVVTFTLDGFSSGTVALELGPGEARQGVNATLIGGTGSMRGTVRDANGTPIGGVAVTVTKGEFEAETATLTTGDTGAFAIVDIPTPGTYAVTFTKDGYLVEARQVTFTAASSQDGVDVVLRPALATIAGRVTGAGAPLTGVEVTLANGTEAETRTTGVATAPAGEWSLTDVAPGSYTLTFRHPAYATRVVIVTVAAGDTATRDVDLEPVGP